MIGKTLAHYEITSQLGKGGMGEVYQATDTKLGRDVAIKVLPEEFARDADRVARFQREAKLLASLNHPNIAAIYGLEESDGTHFLVLELIEGDTLADQIRRGPISVEEALKLALQIAEALETAHEKGVIHRDLKPANIKVTPDGKVKVLDFGLAKAFAGEQGDLNLSNSPTLSEAATMQGVILGTAAYMSPEQARGKPVDKRTDIWAFGCVLYEMLTGRAAFQGEDVTEILAAVVKSEANLNLLPANIHPRVSEFLKRCLQKDQKKRYRDIGDVRHEIEQVLADPGGVFVQPATHGGSRAGLRKMFPWLAVTLILGAFIAGLVVWKIRTPEPPQVVFFDYDLPEGRQFSPLRFPILAVSPDGRQFIYSTKGGIYLRSVNELNAKLISGTDENPQQPFFSPDGQWIGYWSGTDQQLKKISLNGGASVPLCNVPLLLGRIRWEADNTIVYSDLDKGIMRISAEGGIPDCIIETTEAGGPVFPQILPDGKSVLFTQIKNVTARNIDALIFIQSLESGEQRELFSGFGGRYMPTGHIVYGLENSIWAVPFDLDSLKVTGGHVPLVADVFRRTGVPQYALSDSGTMIFIPGTKGATAAGRTLVWVDGEGHEEPLIVEPDYFDMPRISPDGTKVALSIEGEKNGSIEIMDLVRGTRTKWSSPGDDCGFALWTRDGKKILFHLNREGGIGVYWKAADGTGETELLNTVPGRVLLPWSWSFDGSTLVLQEATSGNFEADISVLSIKDGKERKTLLKEKYVELEPKISPDGRWLAYTSSETGRNEICVRPFPEVDKGWWQVSTNGGQSPLWSPDGRELFYRNRDATMAVEVETEPTFRSGKPRELFRSEYFYTQIGPFGVAAWDIHPDGKRFLMIKPGITTDEESETATPRQINIVLNWFEELNQKVPVD